MPEIIAGIDPSTSTGITILQDGEVIHTELLKLKKPGDPNGKAYALFFDTIWALFVKFGVQAFGVETKIPMGSIAANANTHDIATVLYGLCETIAHRLNLEMYGVAVQSWRSTFLRATVAPKSFPLPNPMTKEQEKAFLARERRKWWKRKAVEACETAGVKVKNHDVAESVGIAKHVHKLRNPNGLGIANSLFDLDKTPAEPRTTLTLSGAKSEAEKVFARFGSTEEE